MANPYEATHDPRSRAVPLWYVWFCKICQPMWWVGTILIACSWFNVVSPQIGWLGFALAVLSVVGSYVLPSLVGIQPESYVFLDSRMLSTRDYAYHDTIKKFSDGATLVYDGVGLGFRDDEIVCGLNASAPDIDEPTAIELATHARNVFGELTTTCDEFATAVSGHPLRISIWSPLAEPRELYRVVDGGELKRMA